LHEKDLIQYHGWKTLQEETVRKLTQGQQDNVKINLEKYVVAM